MARYIDADKIPFNEKIPFNRANEGETTIKYAYKSDIDAVPTADVRPIIHGKWIELPRTRISNLVDFKCSVCGGNMCMSDDCELEWCGRCGAKMDGKDTRK